MYTLEAVAGDPFSFVEKEGFFLYPTAKDAILVEDHYSSLLRVQISIFHCLSCLSN